MTQQLKFDASDISSPSPMSTILPMLIGIMILSCSAIFTRLSEQELTPLATIFDRFWIASVVLGLGNVFSLFRQAQSPETEVKEAISWLDWGVLFILAIAISLRAGSWAWSLTQTSVANSNLLHNMTPIFATLGGWIFLGHRYDQKYLLGLALAISGVVAIGIQDFSLSGDGFYGDMAALFSSVFYAINFLIIEKLRTKMSTATIMTGSCVCVSVILFPAILLTGDSVLPITGSVWAAILCLGVLSQVIGQGILVFVLNRMKSGPVSLFLLLEPIITALLAWLIFGEQLSPSNWFAFIVVLAGLYLSNQSEEIDPEGV
jgi:drug/metabolite transporter (DMT)-like permease